MKPLPAKRCPSCGRQTLVGGFCSACGHPNHGQFAQQPQAPQPQPQAKPKPVAQTQPPTFDLNLGLLAGICTLLRVMFFVMVSLGAIVILLGLFQVAKSLGTSDAVQSTNRFAPQVSEQISGIERMQGLTMMIGGCFCLSLGAVCGWLSAITGAILKN